MRCPACHSRAIAHRPSQPYRYLCTTCQNPFSHGFRGCLRRWVVGLGLGLALSPLLLLGATYGLLSLLPTDDGQPVDAIVVLGRGPENRVERSLAAAQLWKQKRAEKVFASGMGDAPPIIALEGEMGVPASALAGEHCSQSTWENGLFSEVVLAPQGIERIILITDRPHMVRSHLIFRSFGFEVVPQPVKFEAPSGNPGPFYRIMVRELAALVVYGVTGRLQPQSPEARQQSEAAAQATIQKWGCSLRGLGRG